MSDLVEIRPEGLYCAAGDFYIDPWRPVAKAVITHAHSDHARPGSGQYLSAEEGKLVLHARLGRDTTIAGIPYGQELLCNSVKVSFHPAGHILGSSQIRIEHRGEVWVISGDYKTSPDRTCTRFESIACDTFVTECTFGLPIYRWRPQDEVFLEIDEWWSANRQAGRVSMVFAYALGKAQRLLAGVNRDIGPLCCHGAVQRLNEAYRASGIALPETHYTGQGNSRSDWSGALVVAPPSALRSPWIRKFGAISTAFVSGWMRIRGVRRRRSVDRGFVLSDHADWNGLIDAIAATKAERVLVTHGRTHVMVRWLREHGIDASSLSTEYVGESDDVEVDQDDDPLGVAEEQQP